MLTLCFCWCVWHTSHWFPALTTLVQERHADTLFRGICGQLAFAFTGPVSRDFSPLHWLLQPPRLLKVCTLCLPDLSQRSLPASLSELHGHITLYFPRVSILCRSFWSVTLCAWELQLLLQGNEGVANFPMHYTGPRKLSVTSSSLGAGKLVVFWPPWDLSSHLTALIPLPTIFSTR